MPKRQRSGIEFGTAFKEIIEKGETKMKKYVCTICGYVYDEAKGDPDNGIAPGTKWEDVAEDFVCPLCGADKDVSRKNKE